LYHLLLKCENTTILTFLCWNETGCRIYKLTEHQGFTLNITWLQSPQPKPLHRYPSIACLFSWILACLTGVEADLPALPHSATCY
jgi:hypothetical protein